MSERLITLRNLGAPPSNWPARGIMQEGEGSLMGLWPERRAEPEDPSGELRSPRDRPPSAGGVRAAHTEFVAVLAGHPPRTIPLDADAMDLEDRADHLGKVFGALSVYVAVIIDDTAQNAPGRLDLPDVEAILADLASDVVGTIQHAAEDMDVRIA
jgi:hypothetical protein